MNNLAGTVLLQRFRIDALERQDYWGDDYRSWDVKRNIPLMIKILRAELPRDPNLLSFSQGNTTLQTLSHPHIVPFFGLYQDRNLSFFVERFVDGIPLREHLMELRGQPLRTGDALIYLKALCLALGYAQGFGMVHCNIHPGNIWLERSGNILLGGFGFARGIDSLMTPTGLAGPPAYVAPEMLRRQEVSPATDIYGLGLVLFELLTGQHPFLGRMGRFVPPEQAEKLGEAQLNQAPPNPRSLNPALPDGLAQVTLTALAKAPRERYQSPQEMLEIACAMLGSSPDTIPDRFGSPSTPEAEEATLIMAPPQRPAQTYAASPAPGPIAQTQVGVPPAGQTITGSTPGRPNPPYPATQVLPPPPPRTGTTAAYSPPVEEPRRKRSGLVLAAILLGIVLCLLVGGGAAYVFGRGLWAAQTAPTGTASATLAASSTVAASSMPEEPTRLPDTPTAALLQGQLPTDTPLPSATLAPTDTPVPSDTPQPSDTPVPTPRPNAFTVTIQNNLGYPVYVFRDNKLMGTDAIPPRMYIFYRGIPAGRHVFMVCQEPTMNNCRPERQVDVQKDLTIAFP